MLAFALVLSIAVPLAVISTPVFAYNTCTAVPPTTPMSVQQGAQFLLTGTITFDDPSYQGYFIWGPVYWYDNASGTNDPLDNFQLENTPSVYWTNNTTDPSKNGSAVENVNITDYGILNGWQVVIEDNGDGIFDNGTFRIDIWLRAASPDGTPHRVGSQNIYFSMNRITMWEPDQVIQAAGPIVVNVGAWTGGVVVRGKENCEGKDLTGPPPYHLYTKGENPIIAAAQRIGSGAVFAAGFMTTVPFDRWKVAPSSISGRYMDVLLHSAMQWMVPGADNVLWYYGHNASFFANARATPTPPVENLLRVYLPAKGYTVDNDNTTPITASWAASKLIGRDILILANLDNGTVPNGGDPSTLWDNEVAIIKEFMDNGGGVIVLDGGDYSGTGRYNMYHISNKILNKLGFNWRFQSDSLVDDKDNYAYYGGMGTQFRARVLTDAGIGGGYLCGTGGSDNLNEYEPCSLIATPTWSVDVVSILPSPQSGVPPATLTYTVTIQNTGTAWDNYDISVSGTNNVNFVRSLNKTRLYLAAGATNSTVQVQENILGGAPYCTWDTITVTVTGTENSGGTQATDSGNATAHATAAFNVELVSITPESQNGDLNTTVTALVVAKNIGAVTDNLTLSITGNTLGWPGITLNQYVFLNVPSNTTVNTQLNVPIPGSELPGVTNEIKVMVQSGGDPLKTDENKCWVTTNLLREVELVIENQTGGNHQEAILVINENWCGKRYDPLSFKVLVMNHGILDDKYELSATSVGSDGSVNALMLEIMPPELFIRAGKWDFAELSVTVPENAKGCTTYTITVRADGQLASGTLWDPTNVWAENIATVHVQENRCVKVEFLTQDQTGTPDSMLKWWIRIKNLGNVDETQHLTISQHVYDYDHDPLPEWWYQLSEEYVFVPACSIAQAWVELEVPSTPEMKTGVKNDIDVRVECVGYESVCNDTDWVTAHVLVPGARIPEAWLKVTVEAEVKAIQLWPTAWDIGILDETEIAGPSPLFTVRNTGNVPVLVLINGSDAKSAPGEPIATWTLSNVGAIGVNTYAMWYDGNVLTTGPSPLFGLVPTQEKTFVLWLQAPGVITVPARMWTIVTLRAI